MKQLNKYRALSMAVLTVLATDCNSSGTGHVTPGIITTFGPGLSTEETTKDFENSSKAEDAHNKLVNFIQTNWTNLTADMTRGQGTYLTTLADLLKIYPNDKASFYAMTKKKFAQLVPDAQTSPEQFLKNLGYNKKDLSLLLQRREDLIGFSGAKAVIYNEAVWFATQHQSELNNDMRKGHGQYLSKMAELLGIPVEKRAAFYTMTKNKFVRLMPSPKTTPDQLVTNLQAEADKL